jgi:hypothetical protein
MVATASPIEDPFPAISFKMFSQFVEQNFSSKISLAAVLMVMFTLMDNPDLLNLHARQQNPKCEGETRSSASAWMKSLAHILKNTMGQEHTKLFKKEDNYRQMPEEQIITALSMKLDAFAKKIELHSYNEQGIFQGHLNPISYQSIEPIHMICPTTVECETVACQFRSLLQVTKTRDIPKVTLIKGSRSYNNTHVLTGKCPTCQTLYLADHERAPDNNEEKTYSRVYLNSAKYLKVGHSLWVDRMFSSGVLNGIYSFHASAAAYMEYWNNTYQKSIPSSKNISRRQIWQAFVQESLRSIAAMSGSDLVLQDGLAIDEVTKQAFEILGDNGRIAAAHQHTCLGCTQQYKETADVINEDEAAMVGVDEQHAVPALVGGNASGGQNTGPPQIAEARQTNVDQMDVDNDSRDVTMAVLDGICFGPSVCFQGYSK